MIVTEGIVKVFRAEDVETIALKNVSLTIEKGDFVSVMGPSGCGKTTLLNIIGMIDQPSEGKYFLFEQDVTRLTEKQKTELRKQNIGFVFQNFNLIDELTVYENIELPLIYLGWKKNARKKRVEEVIEKMKITHRMKLFPIQLSGGQQQRVAVARAVVTNPPLVLADEPTGNLDPESSHGIMELLFEISKSGRAVIMATHDYSLFQFFKARTLVCEDGKLVSSIS